MGAELISKYFPDLSEQQRQQFAQLKPLYETWNARINVISRQDMAAFYLHHVLHSLGIAKVHDFRPGEQVLDVGTGGGFPGIPLAILYPDTHFMLVDSIAKKLKVVQAVVQALGLTNVTTRQTRVEDMTTPYDTLVSRAVARMVSFYRWVQPVRRPDSRIFYLKGGDISAEMAELHKPYRIYRLSKYFSEAFFETKLVVEV